MAFWDKITGAFIDIIEWVDDRSDTLVWRFERYQNEIKNGARLTVRQQQVAILVNGGQITDIFSSGMYELSTENMPILSELKGWRYGFNSPFKAEVYFVNLRTFTDNKWGTKNPVMLRDPEFGPIRIRAFGNFSIKVLDAEKLLNEIVGTDGHFTLDEIHSQLKALAVSRFSDAVAESKIPVLDLAANYDELSELMKQRMNPDFEQYGLCLSHFLVENISLPPNVEQALDKRSSMGIIGNLNSYSQYQSANAMEQAAKNPGGDAGSGVGMGLGFAMANQLAESQGSDRNVDPGTPPPLPTQKKYFVAINGVQTGPFTLDVFKQKIISDEIKRSSLVWTEGMPGWLKAQEVDELLALFAPIPSPSPPPLPPSS
ncbi:MAG TPA: SPFH domain-containing protein [Gammaproteobacteria bacterium]|nr:SPFH domain-containing protein [Gammaproteobacteria bacterium]